MCVPSTMRFRLEGSFDESPRGNSRRKREDVGRTIVGEQSKSSDFGVVSLDVCK